MYEFYLKRILTDPWLKSDLAKEKVKPPASLSMYECPYIYVSIYLYSFILLYTYIYNTEHHCEFINSFYKDTQFIKNMCISIYMYMYVYIYINIYI